MRRWFPGIGSLVRGIYYFNIPEVPSYRFMLYFRVKESFLWDLVRVCKVQIEPAIFAVQASDTPLFSPPFRKACFPEIKQKIGPV